MTLRREKGDRHPMPERPGGCCAQMVPVPLFAARGLGAGGYAAAPFSVSRATVFNNVPCSSKNSTVLPSASATA